MFNVLECLFSFPITDLIFISISLSFSIHLSIIYMVKNSGALVKNEDKLKETNFGLLSKGTNK